jgi:Asp-tRNA(Asn)/Glu-tRNA(Gln) amidotransferase C subunit
LADEALTALDVQALAALAHLHLDSAQTERLATELSQMLASAEALIAECAVQARAPAAYGEREG